MRTSETSQMHFVALIDPINEKRSKEIERKAHRKYQEQYFYPMIHNSTTAGCGALKLSRCIS
jgi:disulfide oxidoreductase YuzD